jgi:hypothetical protein
VSRQGSALPWVLGLGVLAAIGGAVYVAHKTPEKKPAVGAGKADQKAVAGAPPPPLPAAGATSSAATPAKAAKAAKGGGKAATAAPGLPPGFTPPPGASAKVGLESIPTIPTKDPGPSGPMDSAPSAPTSPAAGDPGYMPEGGGSGDSYVKVTSDSPAAAPDGGVLDDFTKGAESLWKDATS